MWFVNLFFENKLEVASDICDVHELISSGSSPCIGGQGSSERMREKEGILILCLPSFIHDCGI